MWIYASIFILPALWLWSGGRSRDVSTAVAVATAVALALFVGLRRHVGGDWHSYWLMYERSRFYPLADAFVISDPAYMALNILASRSGLGIGWVNLACAALLAAGVASFAKGRAYPALALLVALPMLVIVMGMNTTRQSVALGLELLACAFALRGRPRLAAAMIPLAIGFHWTAFILVPLAVIWNIEAHWKKPAFLALAAAAAALALTVWLTGAAADPEGGTPQGVAFRLIPSVLAMAILAAGWRRWQWDANARDTALYLAGTTLFCCAIAPVAALAGDRLGYYTIGLQMLVFAHLPAILPERFKTAAAAGIAALYLTLFTGWAALSSATATMAPYRSFLAEPARLFQQEPLVLILPADESSFAETPPEAAAPAP
ncbi:MAG TPA: EpsG family protein [Allosphingosinicella sp.]|jgi:hypothetical protein